MGGNLAKIPIVNNAARNMGSAVWVNGDLVESYTIASNICTGTSTETRNWNGVDFCPGIELANGATAWNLIIHGNSFSDGIIREARSAGDDPEKNCFFNCLMSNPEEVYGEGNFSGDPLFRNPEKIDFHIKSTSPCKNAGLVLDWMTPGTTDLDDNQRVFEGTPDLGCYENVTFSGTMLLLR